MALIFLGAAAHAQDSLLNRLQGLERRRQDGSGKDIFLNVDGVEIAVILSVGPLTPNVIANNYKQLKVKTTDLNTSDSLLHLRNYYVSKTFDRSGLPGYADEYFIDHNPFIAAFAFQSTRRLTRDFERQIAMLYLDNKIPAKVYQPSSMDSINFAGRYIALGGRCYWTAVNTLQCPSNGEMNWSSFPTLEQAQLHIDDHFEWLRRQSKGRVISDEKVDVTFEGQEMKARKVVYNFKGITSALIRMSGGKTLTIYMVAAEVRGKFISCVMSHWNNDYVGIAGIPALTYTVMQLKQ